MFGLIVVVGCAALFYRIGEMEYGRGWPLALLSVIISLTLPRLLRLPFIDLVIGQLALFIGVWIYNFFRKKPFN